MQDQLSQRTSMDQLAFEHYRRTGQRLTTTQFIDWCEKKFNSNHDELGRFTFGAGYSGGGGGRTTQNGNASSFASPLLDQTWMDSLRSIFGSKPAVVTPAPRPAIRVDTIAEIPDYSQKDKTRWRSSNDHTFVVAAAYYNHKYHLENGDSGYRTPELLKAWAMVESGGEGDQAAFQSDPFQVNNPGDYGTGDTKFRITGLRKGQKMTPGVSALAALEWLRFKGQKHDISGRIVESHGDEIALQNYNGRNDVSPKWGNVKHKVWYAKRVLQLASSVTKPKK